MAKHRYQWPQCSVDIVAFFLKLFCCKDRAVFSCRGEVRHFCLPAYNYTHARSAMPTNEHARNGKQPHGGFGHCGELQAFGSIYSLPDFPAQWKAVDIQERYVRSVTQQCW